MSVIDKIIKLGIKNRCENVFSGKIKKKYIYQIKKKYNYLIINTTSNINDINKDELVYVAIDKDNKYLHEK